MGKLCPRDSYRQIKTINKPLIKKLLCLLGGVLLLSYLSAQKIKPLYIDDSLPDIPFGKVINYKDSSASLASFKGKLILFDFWFTHCSFCIEAMPKLDSLQKLYAKALQVIMVTQDPLEKVVPFIRKYEQQHHVKWTIPIVVGDTVLHQYFRHFSEPHYAWLAPENRLVAQSSFFFLNKEIMEGYLKQLPEELARTGYRMDSLIKN